MLNAFKLLLYPWAILYNGITALRNYFFDKNLKSTVQFKIPVIAIGNLNVGGSGKTPMVEYLIKLLKNRNTIATVSRGYGRNTRGYRRAHAIDTAQTIGDEPLQLFKKFGQHVAVVVGEKRSTAIDLLLKEIPTTNVILLDDAFQHRSIKATLTILLTEFSQPFYKDFLLPYGRLREARKGGQRADIVVITKCPQKISKTEKEWMSNQVKKYAGAKPVFFTSINYSQPQSGRINDKITDSIILVSGIAHPHYLKRHMCTHFDVIKHFVYPDHHQYIQTNIKTIDTFLKNQRTPCSIVFTEKDMAKLTAYEFKNTLDTWPWFYIPYEHRFMYDDQKFNALIIDTIRQM